LINESYDDVYPFGSAERVKLDLFKEYKVIAAAGDRHLVEFLPSSRYLKDEETIKHWMFHRTPVQLRLDKMNKNDEDTLAIIAGSKDIDIYPSGEEGIAQIKALLGLQTLITNVNLPNVGQIENLPLGHIVETNARFTLNKVQPLISGKMDKDVVRLTMPHICNHQSLIKAFRTRNLNFGLEALINDPLLIDLSKDEVKSMFYEIKKHMGSYLDFYHE